MFPSAIEIILAEQYPAFRVEQKQDKKKKERRVLRVSDTQDEAVIYFHDNSQQPANYKVKKRDHDASEQRSQPREKYTTSTIDFNI